MYWAQVTFLILYAIGVTCQVLGNLRLVRGPVTVRQKGVVEATFYLFFVVVGVLVAICTGAFDQIIGWPK